MCYPRAICLYMSYIMPQRSYTGLGSEANKGSVTWLIYPGVDNKFTLFHPDKSGSSTVSMHNYNDRIELSLSESKKSSVFNIHLDQKPLGVNFNGKELNDSIDFSYDAKKARLIAKISEVKDGVLIIKK